MAPSLGSRARCSASTETSSAWIRRPTGPGAPWRYPLVSWKRSTLTARNRPNVGSPSDRDGPRTTWYSNAVTVSLNDPDTFTHLFGKLTETAGVPGVRFHDLRHAYATALLRRGVHPKVVSEALGHASTSFTLDTYTHVVPSMQRAAADAIEQELG